MPRTKKTVPEAEIEVKKKSVNSDKKKEEKIEIEEIKEKPKQKAFFFPRLIAYIIDTVIVSLILSLVLVVVPQSENYETYLKEYEQVQADFLDEKIDADEYINRSIEVVHDIDYSNVVSMILEVVIIILYFVVFQCYNKGQTLGKKLMHIRVVSATEEDLTVNHYIFRSVIINSLLANILIIGMVLFMNKQIYYYASFGLQGIQILLVVISIFMVLYKKDGRGIQDLVANTKVVMCDEE